MRTRTNASTRNKTKKFVPKNLTIDSYQNTRAGLGISKQNTNIFSGSTYTLNPITQNKTLLENAYRSSFIAELCVNLPAEDMTKKGIKIHSTKLTPEQIKQLDSALNTLDLWNSLSNVLKWSRLYGGSIGYMLIDGQDPSTELELDSLSLGQFKGVLTLDRWQVQPSSETITAFGVDFGLPMYYTIVSGLGTTAKIHHSRILRFTGIELPYNQTLNENGWGMSVIEPLYDRLVAYDSATVGAAQMVFRANLRTLKVEGLRQILSKGNEYYSALMSMVENLKVSQANEGIALIDSTDEMGNITYNFSGLSDLINTFQEQVSASIEIPLQRLLGQQSSGFGNGEDNLKNYASNINRKQENKLRKPLTKLLAVLSCSVLGIELPEDFNFEFNGLLEQNNKEIAETITLQLSNILSILDKGVITVEEAKEEIKQLGVLDNIS